MAAKINLKDCIQCYACENTCSKGAISETPKGPKVNTAKCTDCGECKEMCPANCIS